jgi:hypothetical protein
MAAVVKQVSATCIAELLSSLGSSWKRRLPPYKDSDNGQGRGRGGYYRPSLRTIQEFCQQSWRVQVFEERKRTLEAQLSRTTDSLKKIEIEQNIDAIDAYRKIYGNRRFLLLTNHRLWVEIAGLRITSQPDLWVEENGIEVLIKIGAAPKKADYIDILLALIHKAANARGHEVPTSNVVYLDITNRTERVCVSDPERFNMSFDFAARSVLHLWDVLETERRRQESNAQPFSGNPPDAGDERSI